MQWGTFETILSIKLNKGIFISSVDTLYVSNANYHQMGPDEICLYELTTERCGFR